MDKDLIAERFTKAKKTYTQTACVQHLIAEKMMQLLLTYTPAPKFHHIVEFGCGTGIYSRMLQQELHSETLLLNDLCPAMENCINDLQPQAHQPSVHFIAGDAEQLNFPSGTDLITSCSTLQWFEHPQAFFIRCQHFLSANGYFAFSTFGQDNLKEIKQLTGEGLSYLSLEQLGYMLEPYFEMIYMEEEIQHLTFDTPMQVLYHLKQTGVTGTKQSTWTRGRLQLFNSQFIEKFSREEDGKVILTYHPIYVICRKTDTEVYK